MSKTLVRHNSLEVALGLQNKSPVEQFYENPSLLLLRRIPEELQTPEMAALLVTKEKYNIRWIPKKLFTNEVCELAIENDGSNIEFIPADLITPSLALKAVRCCLQYRHESMEYPIHYIPSELITNELVFESVRYSPCSLKNIPSEFISNDLIKLAISGNGRSLEFVPENKRTRDICKIAFENNIYAIKWIPADYISREMFLTIIEAPNSFERREILAQDSFQEEINKDKNLLELYTQRLNNDEKIRSEKQKSIIEEGRKLANSINDNLQEFDGEELPSPLEYILVPKNYQNSITHELVEISGSIGKMVFYITDIHLEHQLKDFWGSDNVDYCNIHFSIGKFIDEKIAEMLSEISDKHGILLIGGDVSHTKDLSSLFYQKLSYQWHGTIISILGNHELWNLSLEDAQCQAKNKTINEIADDYRSLLNKSNSFDGVRQALLQNAVYILYKNKQGRVIEENQILNATDEDLKDICSKSSFILLGGIGFSGLNPVYNAESGLYRTAVTTLQEDRALSEQFRVIYDKLNRCAGDRQVIVLTHMPVYDWTNEPYNPNWVYINGHTHQNSLIRKPDGTTVLSDNQIGYKPKKWTLNAFTVSGWYDPFRDMADGIHEISSEAYKEFNLGRGIKSNGCSYPGKLYALKREGIYMFLLKSRSSLCLLQGGQRKRLDCCDVKYYFDNMSLYAEKVRQALLPYQRVMQTIAKEVKLFGGWGRVHGCIIDIDFFNHIYVNPFDGKITPYFAYDTSSRFAYNNLFDLLKIEKPDLLERFQLAQENGHIPMLSRYATTTEKSLPQIKEAIIPKLVIGTEIYEPSKIMRSIQYIFDDNVIRIWQDDILTLKLDPTPIEAKSEIGE
ncbi:MAG: metallophosphoesterase [Oscillospiraceae bacterium]|nr:metallophosphoesterase [Oscillospiraceae bacterium]